MTALPASKQPGAGTCRILHLEDSPIDAELVGAHLARSGFVCTLHLVATREAYAAALADGGFDLILADYVLPNFDGLAALALAREVAPDTPFIFVSGTLGEEAAVEAVKRGATDYVVKQRLTRLPISVERTLAEARARAGQHKAVAALRESEARLRLALEAGRLGAWELDLRSFALEVSDTYLANFGHSPDTPFTYDDLRAAIHPDDRAHTDLAMARSISEGADYEIEHRAFMPDGSVRWVQVRGRPTFAADRTPLSMAGVSLDVTERKIAEQRQALLAREVDHRAKNALAVVQATLRLTRAADMSDYIRIVEGRVAALARVQTLLAVNRWAGTDLHALLQGELAPFLDDGSTRTVLMGPEVSLPAGASQPLAMAVHELATNAVKHGPLSVAEGRISVSWEVEQVSGRRPLLRLRWVETGGPPVTDVPSRQGFGGRVLDGTVRIQLGGKVSLTWKPVGLICDIEVPLGTDSDHAVSVIGTLLQVA